MAEAGESAYAGIVRMVTAAQTAKAPFTRLADRFALILLPITLVVAGVAWIASGDVIRALAVLVVATPCPLILAAPVAFISGVSHAAQRGILVRGSGPLEALARVQTVLFDKTGTLTVGGAHVIAIETVPGQRREEVLQVAASLDQASHHVVAAAIVLAAKAERLSLLVPEHVVESRGAGLKGVLGDRSVRVGSHDYASGGMAPDAFAGAVLERTRSRAALSVFVAIEGRMIGAILLADGIRDDATRAIQALRASGVRRIVMATGDTADAANRVGAELDLDAVFANQTPAEKLAIVASERRRHPTLMVGDGINDAPALAAADVGIAMGARGASASSEAADIVILVDRIDRVSDAVAIAQRSRQIAMQSIVVGMTLSGIAMIAAARHLNIARPNGVLRRVHHGLRGENCRWLHHRARYLRYRAIGRQLERRGCRDVRRRDFGRNADETRLTVGRRTMTVMTAILLGLAMGAAFGLALEKSRVFEPGVIVGQMQLRSFVMLKIFLTAVATGLVLLAVLNGGFGVKMYPKALVWPADIFGGLLLGAGISLAGACPGTVFAQIGAGYRDAWFTVAGGIAGVMLFGYVEPLLRPVLLSGGPGKPTYDQLAKLPFWLLALITAAAIVALLAALERHASWRDEIGPRSDGLPGNQATTPRIKAVQV